MVVLSAKALADLFPSKILTLEQVYPSLIPLASSGVTETFYLVVGCFDFGELIGDKLFS